MLAQWSQIERRVRPARVSRHEVSARGVREVIRRRLPVVVVHRCHDAEKRMRSALGGIEHERPLRLRADQRRHFDHRVSGGRREENVTKSQLRVRRRIARVEGRRELEALGGTHVSLGRKSPAMMPPLKKRVMCRKLGRIARRLRGQPYLERRSDRLRDLVLDGEHIVQFAVVALRPEVITVRRVDQLRRDANAIARSPHAPLEDRSNAKSLPDLRDVLFLSAKGKRRRARRDLEAGHVRQRVDDLLGQSVAEILIVWIPAHVRERQHRDRWLLVGLPVLRTRPALASHPPPSGTAAPSPSPGSERRCPRPATSSGAGVSRSTAPRSANARRPESSS